MPSKRKHRRKARKKRSNPKFKLREISTEEFLVAFEANMRRLRAEQRELDKAFAPPTPKEMREPTRLPSSFS